MTGKSTTSTRCRGSRPSWALVGAGCSNYIIAACTRAQTLPALALCYLQLALVVTFLSVAYVKCTCTYCTIQWGYIAIIIPTKAFDDVIIALWRVGILGSFESVSHAFPRVLLLPHWDCGWQGCSQVKTHTVQKIIVHMHVQCQWC